MLLKAFLIALSTYSVVPVPQFEWNEKNMKYSICFFPAVGLLCGGALALWCAFCLKFAAGNILFAAVASCVGLLISGGIHMDGFMDTVDALASHQSRERKLEILKDSNCGAFAVIYCALYMLISFGVFSELYERELIFALCPVYVLSRSLSGLGALNIPSARRSGMLGAYTQNTKRVRGSIALGAWLLLAVVAMLMINIAGLVPIAAALVWLAYYYKMVMKQFGGVTGDTAGFFLQLCELFCAFALLIGGLLWR